MRNSKHWIAPVVALLLVQASAEGAPRPPGSNDKPAEQEKPAEDPPAFPLEVPEDKPAEDERPAEVEEGPGYKVLSHDKLRALVRRSQRAAGNVERIRLINEHRERTKEVGELRIERDRLKALELRARRELEQREADIHRQAPDCLCFTANGFPAKELKGGVVRDGRAYHRRCEELLADLGKRLAAMRERADRAGRTRRIQLEQVERDLKSAETALAEVKPRLREIPGYMRPDTATDREREAFRSLARHVLERHAERARKLLAKVPSHFEAERTPTPFERSIPRLVRELEKRLEEVKP